MPGAKSAAVKQPKAKKQKRSKFPKFGTRGEIDFPEPGDDIDCGDLAFMAAVYVLDASTVCSTDSASPWASMGVYENCIDLCDNCPSGYSTDFEAYPSGSWIADVDTNFVVWPGGEPTGLYDVEVKDDCERFPGAHVLYFESSLYSDVVLEFGEEIGSGYFNYEQVMYIPEGKAGYMNFQGNTTIGTVWALDVMFYENGGLYAYAGACNATGNVSEGVDYSGTFPVGEPFTLRFEGDYSTGEWTFFHGEESGTFTLYTPVAGVNLYAYTNNEYYITHVKWEKHDPSDDCDRGDLNQDGVHNVADIVLLVTKILENA